MKRNKPKVESALAIARLLSTEGFTDYLANQVRRYALRHATARQRRRWTFKARAFGEVGAKLSDGEKLILGAFIGAIARMNFDTGLRIGLTASLHPIDRALLDEAEQARKGG